MKFGRRGEGMSWFKKQEIITNLKENLSISARLGDHDYCRINAKQPKQDRKLTLMERPPARGN